MSKLSQNVNEWGNRASKKFGKMNVLTFLCIGLFFIFRQFLVLRIKTNTGYFYDRILIVFIRIDLYFNQFQLFLIVLNNIATKTMIHTVLLLSTINRIFIKIKFKTEQLISTITFYKKIIAIFYFFSFVPLQLQIQILQILIIFYKSEE